MHKPAATNASLVVRKYALLQVTPKKAFNQFGIDQTP
jgi:hypothetical protein